jgi:hypothetical protein
VAGWSLSEEDMVALSQLPVQRHMLMGNVFLSEEGPYKTLKDLWDEEAGDEPYSTEAEGAKQ